MGISQLSLARKVRHKNVRGTKVRQYFCLERVENMPSYFTLALHPGSINAGAENRSFRPRIIESLGTRQILLSLPELQMLLFNITILWTSRTGAIGAVLSDYTVLMENLDEVYQIPRMNMD